MPEGVEVKIQTEKLQKLKNKILESITIHGGRYTRHSQPINFDNFSKSLPLKILGIHQKGKFIYISLSKNWTIMITLGMTGKLKLRKNPPKLIKHDHIVFSSINNSLVFNDLRNFGTIQFTNDPNVLLNKLNKLGFDPLQNHITPSEFLAHIGKFPQNKKIGELLLDQRFISGVGNYLRADIMYCSKIHPNTEIGNIPPDILQILLKCIIKTMKNSYKKQTTKSDYKFVIYKQPKSPLGNPTEKIKDKQGRTIWFVPAEQIYYK